MTDPEQDRIAYLRQHASTDAERTELAIYEAEGKVPDSLALAPLPKRDVSRYVEAAAAVGIGLLILLTWEPVVSMVFFGWGLGALSRNDDGTWSIKVTKREWRTTAEDER